MRAEANEPGETPIRLASWSSMLTAVLAAALLGVGFFTPARSGPFCTNGCLEYPFANASQYFPGDYYWMIPGLLLVPVVLLLGTSLRSRASGYGRPLGGVGVQLATAYGVVIFVTYLTQILAVGPALDSGHAESIAFLSQYDPNGFFVAMECVGYLLLNSALLAFAGSLGPSRLESAVRWAFVAGFGAALAATLTVVLTGAVLVLLEVVLITISAAVLSVSGVLLSRVFSSASHLAASTTSAA